jgi:hypothetical protein
MKLLPMILPVLVGSQVKVVSLALVHLSHASPNLVETSRRQLATASAKAAPRPSSSLVLVKGRNLVRPLTVTRSFFHTTRALAGATSASAISSAAPAIASAGNRAFQTMTSPDTRITEFIGLAARAAVAPGDGRTLRQKGRACPLCRAAVHGEIFVAATPTSPVAR